MSDATRLTAPLNCHVSADSRAREERNGASGAKLETRATAALAVHNHTVTHTTPSSPCAASINSLLRPSLSACEVLRAPLDVGVLSDDRATLAAGASRRRSSLAQFWRAKNTVSKSTSGTIGDEERRERSCHTISHPFPSSPRLHVRHCRSHAVCEWGRLPSGRRMSEAKWPADTDSRAGRTFSRCSRRTHAAAPAHDANKRASHSHCAATRHVTRSCDIALACVLESLAALSVAANWPSHHLASHRTRSHHTLFDLAAMQISDLFVNPESLPNNFGQCAVGDVAGRRVLQASAPVQRNSL